MNEANVTRVPWTTCQIPNLRVSYARGIPGTSFYIYMISMDSTQEADVRNCCSYQNNVVRVYRVILLIYIRLCILHHCRWILPCVVKLFSIVSLKGLTVWSSRLSEIDGHFRISTSSIILAFPTRVRISFHQTAINQSNIKFKSP